jgi:colanic acid biosynthesis protein WcaH
MTIEEAIDFLNKTIPDPSSGLPEDAFLFVSRLTPLVNVDLLIQDETGRTLLSWRDDRHGRAWHVPGGIVRVKETLETRIRKTAEAEIGAPVVFDSVPLAANEFISSRESRGHFISLLYACFLPGRFVPKNEGVREGEAGFLRWHAPCPSNLIPSHERYRHYIERPTAQMEALRMRGAL